MSNKQAIISRLREMNVPFTLYEHEAAHTMADCEALPFAGPDVIYCKNLLLCNRQQTQYYFHILPAGKPFRTADVSKALGVSRLSFAPETLLPELLQTIPGSLAPFSLWYDREHVCRFSYDSEVLNAPKIAFHPSDNTATLVFAQEDFWQLVVPTLGTEARPLTVPQPALP